MVVIGTTRQSYSTFCLNVVHESTISVVLVSRISLRVFVQTDKHGATFMASICRHEPTAVLRCHAGVHTQTHTCDCVLLTEVKGRLL